MLENTSLLEADILNSYEVDYVSRTRKERIDGVLNKALIGDIEAVAEVDMSRNEGGNPDSTKDDKDNHEEE